MTDIFRKREFAVSFLIILVIQFLFSYLTMVGVVGAEKFMTGSIADIQQALVNNLSTPYLIILISVALFVLIAKVVIFTKRFRGVGVKGIFAWLGGLIAIFSGVDLFLAVILLLVPTNYFNKR